MRKSPRIWGQLVGLLAMFVISAGLIPLALLALFYFFEHPLLLLSVLGLSAVSAALFWFHRRSLNRWLFLASHGGFLALAVLLSWNYAQNPTPSTQAMMLFGVAGVGAAHILTARNSFQLGLTVASLSAAMLLVFVSGYIDSTDIEAYLQIALTIGFWIVMGLLIRLLRRGLSLSEGSIAQIDVAAKASSTASALEAERRYSARLLHDTVLSTLTLLAHSGVGVEKQELARQAGEDARLLVQLRLGQVPNPFVSGQYNLQPVEESELGNTLESVKAKFERMGLEVVWHGKGKIFLPSHVLDAFLLSVSECLENVRRHSGAESAHVTISSNGKTVTAIITDQGKGFNTHELGQANLGLKESVEGRLREVGGKVTIFSSPGAGTTVIVEVPQ